MDTIRILGKKGRITIPYGIRQYCSIKKNDVLKFETIDRDTFVVKRQHLCSLPNNCCYMEKGGFSILDTLDRLTPNQQYEALVYLTLAWANKNHLE